MFCIKRRPHQDIVLQLEDGRQITVGLSFTSKEYATVCVDAPKSVSIMRAEECKRVFDPNRLLARVT